MRIERTYMVERREELRRERQHRMMIQRAIDAVFGAVIIAASFLIFGMLFFSEPEPQLRPEEHYYTDRPADWDRYLHDKKEADLIAAATEIEGLR